MPSAGSITQSIKAGPAGHERAGEGDGELRGRGHSIALTAKRFDQAIRLAINIRVVGDGSVDTVLVPSPR